MAPSFEAIGCSIVGCSNDSKDDNAAFASTNGFTFPLLCDTDLKVSIAYGAAVDVNARGASRVAALIVGGSVAKYYSPAGKAEFPAQVLADAKALIEANEAMVGR